VLANGVYPAAITPFSADGGVDMPSVARLLASFEATGCKGVVLAGTNGEGPSLSAVEKRDLIRDSMPLRGSLDLILGIATPSSSEAAWLCNQAHRAGAVAVLLMAPFYFRDAGEEGVAKWFETVMDRSPIPVLIYNFPSKAGFTVTPDLLVRLANHERFLGAKDSSGEVTNIQSYKQAVGDRLLLIGNEGLLISALKAGWNGTISGAANVIPQWLSQIVREWFAGDVESAETKFKLALPAIDALRSIPQPSMNKALLERFGVIAQRTPRLPLLPTGDEEAGKVENTIRQTLGLS
jgi:4-hydroxy-tetrahydrodipicolinate synthase